MHSHAYSRDERCRGRALLERFAAADLAVVAIHAEPETKRIIPALFSHLSGRFTGGPPRGFRRGWAPKRQKVPPRNDRRAGRPETRRAQTGRVWRRRQTP